MFLCVMSKVTLVGQAQAPKAIFTVGLRFAKYGVPYAAKMKSFFDSVFHPRGRTAAK